MPAEVIQKVVRDDFGTMKRCYEEGLGRNRSLKGKLVTKFVIERDGAVSSAEEIHDAASTVASHEHAVEGAESRFPDTKVAACVVSRFKSLTFPRPNGGTLSVVYPIIFSPEN